jgi:hypothetical protein
MLSRKEQEKSGIIIPEPWCQKVEGLLYQTYRAHCERDDKTFHVTGLTYPDEIFIAFTYLDQNQLEKTPVSYIVSVDLFDQAKAQNILDQIVDSVGIFFDQYFASSESDFDGFCPIWTEASLKNLDIYYKVTRENVRLTLEADRLLSQH